MSEAALSAQRTPIVPRRLPGPLDPLLCLRRYPYLVWQLTRREILGRYRGSFAGVLWTFISPLITLALFTFVFSVVFQARWSTDVGDRGGFAVTLFSGFIIFWLFNDCLGRAPTLVLQNVNFVKKIVFPLEILPWTVMIASLFNTMVSVIALVLVHLLVFGLPPVTVVLFPIVLIPFVFMTMGWSWLLASLGVFYRDVGHAVGVALTVVMFTSPIIYPPSAVPEGFRTLIYLNPLSFIVGQAREVLLWGNLPDWGGLAAYLIVSWALMWFGYAWFSRTRRGFANVL